MNDRQSGRVLATALGPALWGTTYVVFTQTLPIDHPLLVSALRALPAGLLMLLLARRLPALRDLPQVTVLALTNIGLFFGLLLISAARLPGGVTATLAACQPLLVGLVAWPLLGRRPRPVQMLLALAGTVGVGLMVLDRSASFDPVGVLAGMGAALSMAFGVVLSERWRGIAPALPMTAWQLTISGLLLLPVALLAEGLPAEWTMRNTAGIAYLALFATGIGYWLWISGLQSLGASAAVLVFFSPFVAVLLGVALLGETLSARQYLGMALVFASVGLSLARRPAAGPAPGRGQA